MCTFELIKDYKDQDQYRSSFNQLAKITFGLDFEPWYKEGFWNDRYLCYSLLNEGEVVSNVSINKMNLIWQGVEKKAIQIGTVMTHPEYQRMGLGTRLMETVIKEYENQVDFIYLFGNDLALRFYKSFGFEKLMETSFVAEYSGNENSKKKSNMRKLDISNPEDLRLIEKIAKGRGYNNETLSVIQDEHLIMFYALYVFYNQFYYIPEEELIVIFEVLDDGVHLYEVLSKKMLYMEDILELMGISQQKIYFHFTPKVRAMNLVMAPYRKEDCTLLVKPMNLDFSKGFLFPETSHA